MACYCCSRRVAFRQHPNGVPTERRPAATCFHAPSFPETATKKSHLPQHATAEKQDELSLQVLVAGRWTLLGKPAKLELMSEFPNCRVYRNTCTALSTLDQHGCEQDKPSRSSDCTTPSMLSSTNDWNKQNPHFPCSLQLRRYPR